jgi:GTP-binding protein
MALINWQDVTLTAVCGNAAQFPPVDSPEVAFIGRSNAGKSSLLNKLINRKSLAKVSATPGKTQTINFYNTDGIYLVDLPGYGYAKRARTTQDGWSDLIWTYFESERSHNLAMVLLDIRHEPSALDQRMVSYLKESELPYVLALTKSDKLSRAQQAKQRAAIARALATPQDACVVTSSESGQGIPELKAIIAEACL